MSASTPADTSLENRTVARISWLIAAIHALFAIFLLSLGIGSHLRAFYLAAAIPGGIALLAMGAMWLNRRNRGHLGVWLLILAIGLGAPGMSLAIVEIGWLSLIGVPAVLIWIAGQALPARQKPWANLVGALSGVSALLLDYFGAENRLAIPSGNIVIPALAVLASVLILLYVFRRFANFPLPSKLLLLFMVVSLLPLGLLAFLNYRFTRDAQIEVANQSLSNIAAQTATQIDAFFTGAIDTLEADAILPAIRNPLLSPPEERDAIMRSEALATLTTFERKDSKHIIAYFLLDREGRFVVSYPLVPGELPEFLGVDDAYKNSLQVVLVSGNPNIFPVRFDPQREAPFIDIAIRVSTDSGIPLGLMIVRYDASILQDLIVANNGLAGKDSYGLLLDEYQLVLAQGADSETLYRTIAPLENEQVARLQENYRLPEMPVELSSINQPELAVQIKSSQTTFTVAGTAGGVPANQVALAKLSTRPWTVAFFQPQNVFLSFIEQQTRLTVILVVIIAIIVALSTVGVSRLIAAPITNLTELVERISAGDLTIQVPAITPDEIGRLATAFNSMTAQIRGLLSGLEQQVANRTKELERRATQLQAAAEVARDASSLQDLEELLNRTVTLISERFGYYHTGIFLLDDREEYAVMRASNSAGGKLMLIQGHKLKVGEVGIVGDTTATGRPHIALDVDQDRAHFAHPYLPATRSEMALPLKVGDRIIGALDVQSERRSAFDESDVEVLQVMADQLAVAIENARLLSEVQNSIREIEAAYGEYTQKSWRDWLRSSQRPSGYRYQGSAVRPSDQPTPESLLAWESGERAFTPVQSRGSSTNSGGRLVVPIKLRNQTFGVIEMSLASDQLPEDFSSLVDALSERLALALDGARLYQDTQRRAAQEQMTREISSHIRETLDVDSVLRIAAQEIGAQLGLHDLTIQLELPSQERE